MKTIYKKTVKVAALLTLTLIMAMPAKAQLSDNYYANMDWQMNFPVGNHFAEDGSGWGMNFEAGYYLTENASLGLFMAYHSNHEYLQLHESFYIHLNS